MAITQYAELKTAIADWTDDGSEASDYADTYIDLAETYFSQELRTREMVAEASVSLDSSGEGDLPSDFRAVRRVNSDTTPVCSLDFLTPEIMQEYYPTVTSGYPKHYTVEGGKLRVRDTASTVTLFYYQAIPALSDSQATNWLLTRAPQLYLAACEAEHAWRRRDYEGHQRAEQRRDTLMESLRREDKGARWPMASARVKGCTP